MDIIIELRDKSRVDELKQYGELIYISPYTNIVGMSCTPEDFLKIKNLKNVVYCEKADTGRLLMEV